MKRVFALVILAGIMFSWPVDVGTVRQAAEGFIAGSGQNRTISKMDVITYGRGTAYVFHLAPKGFIALNGDSDTDPMIGWSFDNDISLEDSPQNAALDLIRQHADLSMAALPFQTQEETQEHGNLWQAMIDAAPFEEETVYGPFIDTDWDQGTPYNTYAPIDPETGRRSVTGCVATAMAQVIDYYEYPSNIRFYDYFDYTSTYTDPEIYIEAEPASIDSIDYNGEGTTPTNNMIAKLMKACGVSVQMNYSSEASGTNVYAWNMISTWRFGYAVDLMPEDDDFLTELASSIMDEKPCLFSMYGPYGGHEVVCDGYNSTSNTFHLNMGWGGSGNGWFNFTSTMPTGFTYVTGAVAHITKPRYRRLNVPSSYDNIQEAVHAAWTMDTIVVADGRHRGAGFYNINAYGKNLYIRSESGAPACTLSGYNGTHAFETVSTEGRDMVIDGFTLTNFMYDTTGSIAIKWASPIIRNCIISDNSTATDYGGHGMYMHWAYPRVENTVITGCYAEFGGGIKMRLSSPEIIGCTITENHATYGGGVWMSKGSDPVFINTIIDGNTTHGVGRAMYLCNVEDSANHPIIYHSIIPLLEIEIEPGGGEYTAGEGAIYSPVELDDSYTPDIASYAIDAGTPALTFMDIKIPATDLFGNERPQGEACDIGAIETAFSPENRPPYIYMDRADKRIPTGSGLSIPFMLSDPEGDPITRELDAPSGATVIGGSRIVWDADAEGTYTFSLTATDGEYADTATFDVVVTNGICGTVSGVWDAGVYEIECDIYVEDSLILMPGAELVFNGPYNLFVVQNALLIAEGTEDDSVIFRADAGSWGGISLTGVSDRSSISYAAISDADQSLRPGVTWGGGLSIVRCSPSVSNSLFRDNTASSGAGIYVDHSSSEITGCSFIDNHSLSAGGGLEAWGASPSVTDCLFQGNSAEYSGGGMSSVYSYLNCDRNVFTENTCENDGAGLYVFKYNADISDCEFIGNGSGEESGGGIAVEEANVTVTSCLFEDNYAGWGGAIHLLYQYYYSTRIEKNIFIGNTAINEGGGIHDISSAGDQILTNVFIDNQAARGGAMYLWYSSPHIINNTITGNNTTSNRGGGICADYNSLPIVHNSIVRGNTSDTDSNRSEIYVASSDCIVYVSNSNVNRSKSGGYGIISWRDGNIEEDPMFTDDYHISGRSPCVNAGVRMVSLPDGSGSLTAPFRDIDDTFRPQDGEWDIGADETALEGILETLDHPGELTLSTYPNPFNSTLSINAPEDAFVTIYDTHGRQVADLGRRRIWNAGKETPSGVYIVRATVGKKFIEEKTVLVK